MTKADIFEYFQAEKAESLFFVGIGAVSVVTGLVCLFYFKSRFAVGAAIPLLLVALIQLVVGSTVYLRTDQHMEQLVRVFQQSPAAYAQEELPRMAKVNTNFDVYKIIEIGLLLSGLALVAFYFGKANRFWLGFGAALSLQSSIMLAADLFAESRADAYTVKIEQLSK